MEDKIPGIEFLNSKKVPTKEKLNWKLAWTFFSMGVFFCSPIIVVILEITFLFCGVSSEYTFLERISRYIIYSIMGFALPGILGLLITIPVEYEIVYNVAVLDESAIVELKKSYEIINQRGKLYTVRKNNKIKG